MPKERLGCSLASLGTALSSRCISNEWAGALYGNSGSGEEWETTAPQPSCGGGSMLELESSLHSSMTFQPSAALATSKMPYLWWFTQIIKSLNLLGLFSLSCVAFDVAASLCRCNNNLGQRTGARALPHIWMSQLWFASAGRHDRKESDENLPGPWKILLDPPRRPGSYNCLLLTALWRFVEQVKNRSSWLQYSS